MQVQITFKERPIYRAPLALLERLYFYTLYYGLSVSHYTGKHQSYWEKLPGRLRAAHNNPEDLESIIQELERLAEGAEERAERRRAQKDGGWAEKEVVLNDQLVCVLAALPDELLASGFRKTVACDGLPGAFRIVDLKMQGSKGEHANFVEPDLLLLGDGHLLMVEIKARAGPRSYCVYPPFQLLNYLHLVAKCREANDPDLPEQFAHLILVPSTAPKWLKNHAEWVLATRDEEERLRVDSEACIRLTKHKAGYDYDYLARLTQEIPIYYRSWQQFHEAFELAISQFGDERNLNHWQRIGGEVKELARRAGEYK
jgi:hypothetical protein